MNRIFSYTNIDSIITMNQTIFLGHDFGQGWFCKNKKIFAIDISKNASSSGKQFFKNNNFAPSNFNDKNVNPEKFIAILRDPIERWISGLAEYIAGDYGNLKFKNVSDCFFNNELLETLIFDQIVFDGHTLPQIAYLQGLDIRKIDFYYFDNDVFDKISYYNQLDNINLKYSNSKTKNEDKIYIHNYLASQLKDSEKMKKIQRMYYCDYQLFDEIKFV